MSDLHLAITSANPNPTTIRPPTSSVPNPTLYPPSPTQHSTAMIPCVLAAACIITCPVFILLLFAPLLLIAAKAALYTVPLIVFAVLALYAKHEFEEAEERRRSIRAAEKEQQRQREREAFRRAEARQRELRAEAARRAEAERRAEARRVGVTLPVLQPQPQDSGGWFIDSIRTILANVAQASASSSGHDNLAFDATNALESPSADAPTATSGGDCVICLDRVTDTLLMPCKHLVLCGVSAVRLSFISKAKKWLALLGHSS